MHNRIISSNKIVILIGISYVKKKPLGRIRHFRPLKSNKNRSGTGERKMYT